ncbi:hypothetical protein ADZ36_02820 [Streptomyces fradiae]|uniref:CHAT domain-containing protein n=3 Tax=Streptomyces TaxID=1883 RepID=A0A3R7IYU0_9ACTN|nr:hypothetical protein ADZ36_02820 [Streptomyces fradiae]OFA55761.1 hypothetical protein BEN35_07450 [Streptomyces fradiae]PQM23882.1 CHAT domain-containing protein [Streptomyces xinghaiensis]RKM92007.1 CHAT domain-containing protein [Streptomyces xinghaiensis]RNC73574.1 CHAT domain-containing protein [Streptomyces xinghaiensis]
MLDTRAGARAVRGDMREELLAALEERIRHAEEEYDAAGLLEQDATDQAARLSRSVAVPEDDVEVCQVLGRFHVLRHQILAARSTRAGAAELPSAIRFLAALYLHDPQLVPDSAGQRSIVGALDVLEKRPAPGRTETRQDLVRRVVEMVAYPDRARPADGGWQRIEWLRNLRRSGRATPQQLAELASLLIECPRYVEALDLLTEAVACLEQLSPADRQRYPVVLLNALNARAARLAELGRPGDAATDGVRAMRIARALVVQSPLTERARLAHTLHFMAKYLDTAGRPSEALEYLDEAAPLYERLAAEDPQHGASLADVRKDWARVLRTSGRAGDSLVPAAQAVTGFRTAAAVNPRTFTRHLGFALEEYAACLSAVDRDSEAVPMMTEAVEIFRTVVTESPESPEDAADGTIAAEHRAELAQMLCHLGYCLLHAEQPDQACETLTESVTHYEKLTERHLATYRDGLASALDHLSAGYEATGRWDEACATAARAVDLARDAAAHGGVPEVHLLARALGNWSGKLGNVDRREEAERAAREAVGLWQSCAETDPAYGAYLADALADLARRQKGLLHGAEAVATAWRAVSLYRVHFREHRSPRRGPLAAALLVLGECRIAAGRDDEAVLPLRQSVALYRVLTGLDPTYAAGLVRAQMSTAQQLARTFRHAEALALAADCRERAYALADAAGGQYVAEALGAHTTVLSLCGRPAEASETAEASARAFRELAAGPTGTHRRHELGSALLRLSACLLQAQRPREALSAVEEAHGALTASAERSSAWFAPFLADCLEQKAWCLNACGDVSGADDCAAEAVGIRREMARRHPAVYGPALAGALILRAVVLLRARRQEAALGAAVEATAFARQAAERDRLCHAMLLVRTLRNEAGALNAVYRREAAAARAAGAVEICRWLVAEQAAECRDELASALTGEATVLMDWGRYDDGVVRAEEAVSLRRELADRKPDLFRADLATDLGTLTLLLNAVGRRAEALAAAREALSIGRALMNEDPVPHGLLFATLLARYGVVLSLCSRPRGAAAALRRVLTLPVSEPRLRAAAASRLGRILARSGDPVGALEAYERAVAEIPALAPRSSGRWDRELGMATLTGIGPDAAAAALDADDARHAVELLERARATLLAERIGEQRAEHPAAPPEYQSWDTGLLSGSRAAATARLWREHARINAEATGPRAERPSVATRFEDLAGQTADGVIVVVNISRLRCDALLITSGEDGPAVRILPLHITYDQTVAQSEVFTGAVAEAKRYEATIGERRAAWGAMNAVLAWLWEHVGAPVLRDIDGTEAPTVRSLTNSADPAPAMLHRVWWCPTGPMTVLPLHACGALHGTGKGQSVLDRTVSSVIPSVTMLNHARRAAAALPRGSQTSLVVSVPCPPGDNATLDVLEQETARIPALLPESLLLPGREAGKNRVLRELESRSLLHFACHCVTDPTRPSAGRLVLHDHRENPLTVLDISLAHPSRAELVCLTACSTADNNTIVIDESVHIAGAFQAAGIPHVIGTMWPMTDNRHSHIAPSVYRSLTDGTGRLQVSNAAVALHQHVRRLRNAFPENPALWANYLHLGP